MRQRGAPRPSSASAARGNKVSRTDLHIHTTASDGKYPPGEIVALAARAGVRVMAICDHDTMNGLAEARPAAQKIPGLILIPGVEMSTDVPAGEVHILGYFVDDRAASCWPAGTELAGVLAQMRDSRVERAQRMVQKLSHYGVRLDWPRVQEIAGGGTVGRPHVAQAMLEKGYINSIKDAFVRYIGRGCPAYVEWEKLTPALAVALIVRSRGLPVLAHPLTASDPESLVAELIPAGLAGLEAFYNWALGLARRYGLLATGGSDYHGLDESAETTIGGAPVPDWVAERLFARAGELARAARPPT
jgi:predicted metal-dependent phosphoesterase TrpH